MKRRSRTPDVMKPFMALLLAGLALNVHPAEAQCRGTVSFEKVSGMTMRNLQMFPLFSNPGSAVTEECSKRCRSNFGCSAFITNYDSESCSQMDLSSSSASSATLVLATSRIHYYQKICLEGPVCERAWAFERVPGRQLAGFDDRTIRNIRKRSFCEDLCLMETSFTCRSCEYVTSTGECRLSKETRRTQQNAFTEMDGVDYLENQCAEQEAMNGDCDFEERPNMDVGHADMQRVASNREMCQEMCASTRLFPCRSFSYNQASALCRMTSDDSANVESAVLTKAKAGTSFFQRSACLNMTLTCSADAMTVTLRTPEPFVGRIYARDEPMLCEAFGNGRTLTQISMALQRSRCGVVEEQTGTYTNVVVVQQHPVLQRKGDKAVKLMCFFETSNRTVSSDVNVQNENDTDIDLVNATAPTPNIQLRITDKNGTDISGATLGDELFLRIEMDSSSVYGIFPRDLVARSGTTQESINLLDSRGCPNDATIFPGLTRENGSTTYVGRFEAFKFSTDTVVRFTVNIQFCLRECSQPQCNSGTSKSSRSSSPSESSSSDSMVMADTSASMRGFLDLSAIGRTKRQDTFSSDEAESGAVVQKVPGSQPVVSVNPDPIVSLQRQITVQSATVIPDIPSFPSFDDDIRNNITTQDDVIPAEISPDLVCTTRTVLIIGGIVAFVFLVCIIAVSCVCVCAHRPRKKVHSPSLSQVPILLPPPSTPPRGSVYSSRQRRGSQIYSNDH